MAKVRTIGGRQIKVRKDGRRVVGPLPVALLVGRVEEARASQEARKDGRATQPRQ